MRHEVNSLLENLILELNTINWLDFNNEHNKIKTLLYELNSKRAFLKKEIQEKTRGLTDTLGDLPIETPTHFKWLIHESKEFGYRIWNHEYKSKAKRRTGYATVPHNHRYWFGSLVLNGGFTNQIYELDRINKDKIKKYSLVSEQNYSKTSVYTLDSNIIHSLDDIQDSTITLIIQSKPLSLFSESFDFEKMVIQKHYSFESHHKEEYISKLDLI